MQTLFLVASHANGDHHWWFPIFPLLWTALIIGAIYLFTRGRRRGGSNRAKEILAERYASGELTIDEYRERLAHLG
jgi:putative membrane protein